MSTRTKAPAPDPRTARRSAVLSFVGAGLLVALTVAIYAPLHRAEFINFDDPEYVTHNPHVQRGLDRASIPWAFTTGRTGNWHPLSWLSHMLDVELFGLRPGGHHATSIALHALNALLLFVALRCMTDRLGPSWLVAALFAVHPLHVESVAWVAERKDVLSTLFWMLAMLAYAGYARRPRATSYLLVAAFLALGLLAKPMLVTLPFVLLLLDGWPLSRLETPARVRRAVLEKLPLLALCAASSAVTVIVQRRGMTDFERLPMGARLANALVSYVRYLAKTFWPVDLAVFYPHPALDGKTGQSLALVIGAALTLVGISVAAWWMARRGERYLLVGWLWFLGTLLPVIGLVQVGRQALADRYTYVPLIGLFMALVWAADRLRVRWRIPAPPIALAAVLCVAGPAALSWRQVHYWLDAPALFEHALRAGGESWTAEFNLAAARDARGESDRARQHYRRSIEIAPGRPQGYVNLGVLLAREGRDEDALRLLRTAVQLAPGHATANSALGALLAKRGQDGEARVYLERALRSDPDEPSARRVLANVRLSTGDAQGAVADYETALHLAPGDVDARFGLALALWRLGQTRRVTEELRRVVQAAPDHLEATSRLAWLLATSADAQIRDPARAVELSERAQRKTGGGDPFVLDALAAGYAAQGRFDEAIVTLTRAMSIVAEAGLGDLEQGMRGRLELYRRGRPFLAPAAPGGRRPGT